MKKKKSINLNTIFLILALIVIAVMGYFIYKLYSDNFTANKKVEKLNKEISSLEEKIEELKELIDYQESVLFDKKPSLWQRFKNSKLARAVSYVLKIRVRIKIELPNALPEGRGE